MKLLIWGVSNIGKTTIGKELSNKLNCKFYDVDKEIIDIYGSIDNFQAIFPNDYDRFDEKEELMMNIIESDNNDFIMAVSPIYSASVVEELLFNEPIDSILDLFQENPEQYFKYMENRITSELPKQFIK